MYYQFECFESSKIQQTNNRELYCYKLKANLAFVISHVSRSIITIFAFNPWSHTPVPL